MLIILNIKLAGSSGIASRAPIRNVVVKNIDSAGQAGFVHGAFVRTETKKLWFLMHIHNSCTLYVINSFNQN